jgi:hypothetical protein
MAQTLSDMKDLLEEYPEASLQIRERLPYNYLMSQMVLTFQKAILNIEYSSEELREASEGFVNMIPTSWRDEEFLQDLKFAEILIVQDNRPEFCGTLATEEFCLKNNIPLTRETKSFDYFKVFNAVINLLNRRGMLLKSQFKEIATGKLYKKQHGKTQEFEMEDAL